MEIYKIEFKISTEGKVIENLTRHEAYKLLDALKSSFIECKIIITDENSVTMVR